MKRIIIKADGSLNIIDQDIPKVSLGDTVVIELQSPTVNDYSLRVDFDLPREVSYLRPMSLVDEDKWTYTIPSQVLGAVSQKNTSTTLPTYITAYEVVNNTINENEGYTNKLGTYDTLTDLQNAHPTATSSDYAVVGDIIYKWDNEWVDSGLQEKLISQATTNIDIPVDKFVQNTQELVDSTLTDQVLEMISNLQVDSNTFADYKTNWYFENGGLIPEDSEFNEPGYKTPGIFYTITSDPAERSIYITYDTSGGRQTQIRINGNATNPIKITEVEYNFTTKELISTNVAVEGKLTDNNFTTALKDRLENLLVEKDLSGYTTADILQDGLVYINEGGTAKKATISDLRSVILQGVVGLSIELVDTLPTEGQGGTLYLVPLADGTGDQNKAEYLWLKGQWEQIGTTKLSLKAEDIEYNTETVKTALDRKVDEAPIDGNQYVRQDESWISPFKEKTQITILTTDWDTNNQYTVTKPKKLDGSNYDVVYLFPEDYQLYADMEIIKVSEDTDTITIEAKNIDNVADIIIYVKGVV